MKFFCKVNWHFTIRLVLGLLISTWAATIVLSQTEDTFGDAAADPVKLFERGQTAQARKEFEKALDFYERAVQIRPEFPEAEFQRGNVLVSLGRLDSAKAAFERAIALRQNWSLPYSALGSLLVRDGKDREAERSFRQALAVDPQDNLALRILAEIRLRSGDAKEALSLAQQATREQEAPPAAWVVRAMAERVIGEKAAARTSLEHALQVEPENVAALLEHAELSTDQADYEQAISDLNRALKLRPKDKHILSRLAFNYERAGKVEEAQRIAQSAGLIEASLADGTIKVIGTNDEIEAANGTDPIKSRAALEKLLNKNPHNAMLLARLGASYSTHNPARALGYYRQAADLEPNNADYAAGYAAALVQTRQFAEAVSILRRVVKLAPDNYSAHANLATALYELKRYEEALPEYRLLLQTKPDLVVAFYFIATAYDYLGEYTEALTAYESFLARADSSANQLEIDKVKLRLPSLRRQIQLGQGAKRKK